MHLQYTYLLLSKLTVEIHYFWNLIGIYTWHSLQSRLVEKPGNIKDENSGAGPVYVGPWKLADRAQSLFFIHKL